MEKQVNEREKGKIRIKLNKGKCFNKKTSELKRS